jgi:hypothetical protein
MSAPSKETMASAIMRTEWKQMLDLTAIAKEENMRH